MLGGKTSDNAPMRGGKHAHYLPLIRERRLTGLVVWVPGGLVDKELTALCDVRALYDYKRRVQVRVSGLGAMEQVAPELVGPARTWRAVTPFTPSRYPKKNRDEWFNFVRNEIQRELSVRGHTPAADVEFIDRPWTAYVRHRPSARLRRDKRQGQAHLPAEFLRLRFSQPVHGPLTLGWLSHFGLGLFMPE
jgi:CRISPR-associated protein Csb2